MNEIFNIKRFSWLLEKMLWERILPICGTLGIAFFLTGIIYFINRPIVTEAMTTTSSSSFQEMAFTLGLTLGGGVLAGLVFAYFSESARGYGYLTLPASAFEKWLCGVLIVGVFTVLFFVFFRIIDTAFVHHFHDTLPKSLGDYQKMFAMVQILSFDSWELKNTYYIYFMLTGVMAIGSLYFNKMALIKSAIGFIVVFASLHYLNQFIAALIFGERVSTLPFMYKITVLTVHFPTIFLENVPRLLLETFFLIVLPIVLWIIAFIRLREKEF